MLLIEAALKEGFLLNLVGREAYGRLHIEPVGMEV
jgi:hypothetical protein